VDTAAVTVLAVTVLAPLLADLPQAILGAIVLVAAIGLVNLAPLRRIRAIRQRDFWLGLVALVGVLVLGVLRGVLEAVIISLLVLLHELDHPRIVAGERAPGLLVVRPEGRLFFANARRVVDRITAIAADWERWCAAVFDSHTAYPMLAFFRYRQPGQKLADRPGGGDRRGRHQPGRHPGRRVRAGAAAVPAGHRAAAHGAGAAGGRQVGGRRGSRPARRRGGLPHPLPPPRGARRAAAPLRPGLG
jgi:hypothetical protein